MHTMGDKCLVVARCVDRLTAPRLGDTPGRMRFFNTSGPVVAADHYCVPPLERIDLSGVLALIGDKRYFVLHAPHQTGKTSALLALRDLLNRGGHGRYRCVYVNVEAGQAGRRARSARPAHRRHRHLVIFDRTADKPWSEKLFRRTESAGGIPITVWGM